MPIELDHIFHIYMHGTPEEVVSIQDLNLRIEDGEYVGVMGHTGCGKSTMIQLIAGLITPTGGKVLLDGENINAEGYDRNFLRRSVGIVFQYPEYQLFETTVEKDVAFGLKHSGLSRCEIEARVKWALEMMDFNFDSVRAQSPMALSGGEKRRAAIAGVLVSKPKILIFDEPIAGLDPIARDAFLALTDKLNAYGTTIIMVSHNADALSEHAKRLIALENGRLIMDGSIEDIYSDAGTLQRKGIGVSQSKLIAEMLRKRGINLPKNIVHYNELLEQLTARFKGEGK